MRIMKTSICLVNALFLGVTDAPAEPAARLQRIPMTSSWAAVSLSASARRSFDDPEPGSYFQSAEGTESAEIAKLLSLTTADGGSVSGPISLAVDSSSGSLVMRLSATLIASPGIESKIELGGGGNFIYTVPDVGEPLTDFLVVTHGGWVTPDLNWQVSLIQPTVGVTSLTLGRPGTGIDGLPGPRPMPMGSISSTPGADVAQIVSLIPGDTVMFQVGAYVTLTHGSVNSVAGETRFEGPLWQLSLVSRGEPNAACKADLNADGVVNFSDLAKMKSVFFQSCTP